MNMYIAPQSWRWTCLGWRLYAPACGRACSSRRLQSGWDLPAPSRSPTVRCGAAGAAARQEREKTKPRDKKDLELSLTDDAMGSETRQRGKRIALASASGSDPAWPLPWEPLSSHQRRE